ncbi:MAG: TrkH family potassium uptake protein [Acetobacteraceae bacterium]|nr:TrkH family potassium uptake protein [Acetobacteraceae bacterium]
MLAEARGPARGLRLSPAQALVLGFLAVIAAGTLLLCLPVATASRRATPVVDALFTATSATCVTGLVVRDTATYWSPFGQAVIALLIQVGGLGIMTMSTLIALVLGKRITLRERLLIQEAGGYITLSGLVRMVKHVLLFTAVLEGAGALALTLRLAFDYPFPRALALGVFHAVSAFNNAGFDLFSTSLVGFVDDFPVILIMAGLIIAGGLGFAVMSEIAAWRRGVRLSLHSRLALAVTAALILGGWIAVFLLELGNPETLAPLSPQGKALASFFHAVTPRTAGFNSVPTGRLRPATQLLTVMLMFIGGSPNSTAGGIKTTTFATVVLAVWAIVRGRPGVEVFERRIPAELVSRALAVTLIAVALVVGMTGVLLITEGQEPLATLFEVTSAFGTVGLSTGMTPSLTTAGRLLIVATMFAGRVGPLTLALAIAHRQRRGGVLRHPEEKIMVG